MQAVRPSVPAPPVTTALPVMAKRWAALVACGVGPVLEVGVPVLSVIDGTWRLVRASRSVVILIVLYLLTWIDLDGVR